MNNKNSHRVNKIVTLSLLTSLALIIFSVENMIPPIVPIQGVKLGLANVITLFLILTADKKSALAVLIVRVLLAAIFAGQAISLIYSLCGGLLALAVMCGVNILLEGRPVWFISTMGAVFHNIGQILAAAILMSWKVVSYLPVLLLSGCITGGLIGILTDITIRKMYKSGILKHFKTIFETPHENKERNSQSDDI